MTQPRLLDLFCGAGGAARGYQRAGFYVVGVDIHPQPRYAGDEFIQGDALSFPLDGFDAIHASPPCQDYSAMRNATGVQHDRLIAQTFALLDASGVPYVIENVEGAWRDMLNAVRLCGTQFGLRVRRHRLFVARPALMWLVPECDCHNGVVEGRLIGHRLGGKPAHGRTKPPVSKPSELRAAIGCDWMNVMEVRQAIPPAYTEYIGAQLIATLSERAA